VLEAITLAGYKPGEHVSIALDPASSEFFDKARRQVRFQEVRQVLSHLGANDEISGPTGCGSSPSSQSKTASQKTIGPVGNTLQPSLADRPSLVGDDLFVTNHDPIEARHFRKSWQRDFDQAQSDRHAVGNDRGH